jgi:hypothetical protein
MKVGDRIVCIDPIDRLKKDQTYLIQGIKTMSCGCVIIDVGHNTEADGCCCGHGAIMLYNGMRVRWYASERFAPIQHNTDEFLNSDQINKVVEETSDAPIKEPTTQK